MTSTVIIQHVEPPTVLGLEDATPSSANWLKFYKLKCKDESGRVYEWEFVERVTKYRETDGSAVFAKVVEEGQPDRLVVIAQYRPPVRSFVLELPAGVIEKDESIEQSALRELSEETGYTGVIHHITPESTNDQGLTTSCLNFVLATVDASAPENANPQPSPELGETLQVLLLPIEGLADTLCKLKQEHNWQIDSRLLAFALGLEFKYRSALNTRATAG